MNLNRMMNAVIASFMLVLDFFKMAASVWHRKSLVGPPVVLLPVKYNIGERAFIQKYKNILSEIDTELRLLKVLEKEVWISKRYIYKYQNSDCNMKWFRQHKMISKTCESLINLQIGKLIISLIPETVGEILPGMKPNMWPSRQMLEYFLVKLLGFASLCLYIWSVGYKANELFLKNMEMKNLFLRNLLQAGILSRMQIIAQHLLEKSCKWYTSLYPWLQRLPELDSSWLPEGEHLPSSIEEALGSELTDLRSITSLSVPKKKKQNTLQRFFNLLDENDVEDAPVPELLETFDKSISEPDAVANEVHTRLSLDDIFSGLVETSGLADKSEKTADKRSVTKTAPLTPGSKMKTGTDPVNKRSAEKENFATSVVLLKEKNRPKEGEENDGSYQIQFKTKKKKKKKKHSEMYRILPNYQDQSEDIGVAVTTEEVLSSESKTKKNKEKNKQLKRKNREDEDEVVNEEQSVAKRRKPDDNLKRQMAWQSMKDSTHGILVEEDFNTTDGDAIPVERTIRHVHGTDEEKQLDRHNNQSHASEEITSDLTQKKRKKKKKKHLREEVADDFIQEDLLLDEKETSSKKEVGEKRIATPEAGVEPAEFGDKTDLGLSETGKKRKKKRKKMSYMPDFFNVASPVENACRESSEMGEEGVEQMPQNNQELGESSPSKRKKRKRKKNKDGIMELEINNSFASKEAETSVESLKLTGTGLSSSVEMEKEGTLKKKKKKKKNLGGSMMNVGALEDGGISGMETLGRSDVDKKNKMRFEAVREHCVGTNVFYSEAVNDFNEIRVPPGDNNNQRLQQKFQGKMKKKKKKNKKGWKTTFQFSNE